MASKKSIFTVSRQSMGICPLVFFWIVILLRPLWAAYEPVSAQSYDSSRAELLENIEKVSDAGPELRERLLARLFKRNTVLFRKVAGAYLQQKDYPRFDAERMMRTYSCGMFSEACDAQLTEQIYLALAERGPVPEELQYLAAVNNESLQPELSYERYAHIVESDAFTPLKEECIRRMFLLSLLSGNKHGFTEWCQTKGISLSQYLDQGNRLFELVNKARLIRAFPSRSFIGQRVSFQAFSWREKNISPGIEPYTWYIAQTEISTQAPMLDHAYFQEGFHFVFMDMPSLQSRKELYMGIIPVYYFQLFPRDKQRVQAGSYLDCKIVLIPYLPTSLYNVTWHVRGPQDTVVTGNPQRILFMEKGRHTMTVIIRFGLYTLQKTISVFVE